MAVYHGGNQEADLCGGIAQKWGHFYSPVVQFSKPDGRRVEGDSKQSEFFGICWETKEEGP